MKKLTLLCVAVFAITNASAERYSTEDESRFTSQDYTKAEAGMLPPAAYIARATKAVRARYSDIRVLSYEPPTVTRRFYRDAPSLDRDIICVKFLYKELIKAPMPAANRLPNPEFMVRPGILVLIRKDLSKIYVNEVYYQIW